MSYHTPQPGTPTAHAHHGGHAHGTGQQSIRGNALARHPCAPGQGDHAFHTPSKKECFSIALRHTLVVLEMH